jgi:NAD(P)H-hydrate epimerase
MQQIPRSAVPALTEAQMREVDRIMVDELGIALVQMMENAGRNLAGLAIDRYRPATVLILAGSGGNGGGGLAAARHLANRGAAPFVVLSGPPETLTPVPRHQFEILNAMGVPVTDEPGPADLIIDAVIGYSLQGDPRGRSAELIRWMNRAPAPVLSLDTPSGLDVTTGQPHDPCVTADATMTLALPKKGLYPASQVGDLFLADISVPPTVYAAFGLEVPSLFAGGTVVQIAR